jgi:hypothetical protein
VAVNLPERLLMFDVDRYVDRLYQPTLNRLGIGWIKTSGIGMLVISIA